MKRCIHCESLQKRIDDLIVALDRAKRIESAAREYIEWDNGARNANDGAKHYEALREALNGHR